MYGLGYKGEKCGQQKVVDQNDFGRYTPSARRSRKGGLFFPIFRRGPVDNMPERKAKMVYVLGMGCECLRSVSELNLG